MAGEAAMATEINNSNLREDNIEEDTTIRGIIVAEIITTTSPIIKVITMVVISNSSENSHYK